MTKGERVEFICTQLRAGRTLQSIGDELGLTRERVRQIARPFGVKRARQASLSSFSSLQRAKKSADFGSF